MSAEISLSLAPAIVASVAVPERRLCPPSFAVFAASMPVRRAAAFKIRATDPGSRALDDRFPWRSTAVNREPSLPPMPASEIQAASALTGQVSGREPN